MVYNCIVKKCKSMYVPQSFGPSVSFHKFPRDQYRKKLWIEGLQLSKSRVYATARVCSKHFDKSDFTNVGPGPHSARKLIETAVPSIAYNNEPGSPEESTENSNDSVSNGPQSPLKILIQEENTEAIECDECCSSEVKSEKDNMPRVELPILYVQKTGATSPNSKSGSDSTGQITAANLPPKKLVLVPKKIPQKADPKSSQALNEEVVNLRKRVFNLQKMYKCKRWSEIAQSKKIKKLEEKNKKLKTIVGKLKKMLMDCQCGDIYSIDNINDKDISNKSNDCNTRYLGEEFIEE